jgi:predicted nuclease with RNAse H fold
MTINTSSPFWLGIDFGAKLAGTTAVCYLDKDKLHLQQSKKKKDADVFLTHIIHELNPTHVFIDAPLSLPGKYTSTGNDYFFRECDKAVGGMSPMFIGGLTARAIKLKDAFIHADFFEAYPSYLAKHRYTDIITDYRASKTLNITNDIISKLTGKEIQDLPHNTHQLDALLCWIIGKRYFQNEAECFGNEQEGLVWV